MRTSFPRKPGFPSRLQCLIDLAGGFERLGRISGHSRRTLSDWARALHEPHSGQYVRLAEACGVDLHWLRTGEGEAPKRLAPPAVSLPTAPPLNAAELTPTTDLVATVPVSTVGFPTIEAISAAWGDLLGVGSGALAVRSADPSAEPLIRVGEPVLAARVRDLTNELPHAHNAIWLVVRDGGVIFRRFTVDGELALLVPVGAGKLKPEPARLESLHVIGRAVWSGVRL